MIKDYIHKVNYHETDKMGITHHANYVKWMEEARISFLEQMGYSYSKIESLGIGAVITELECRYLRSTTFEDEVRISVSVESFDGVTLTVLYKMINEKTGEDVLTGKTKLCFTDTAGNLIILKKKSPEFARLLTEWQEK